MFLTSLISHAALHTFGNQLLGILLEIAVLASVLHGGNGRSMLQLEQELKSNAYPGRGIVIGRSRDGKYAVAAYFIMG